MPGFLQYWGKLPFLKERLLCWLSPAKRFCKLSMLTFFHEMTDTVRAETIGIDPGGHVPFHLALYLTDHTTELCDLLIRQSHFGISCTFIDINHSAIVLRLKLNTKRRITCFGFLCRDLTRFPFVFCDMTIDSRNLLYGQRIV